MSIGLTRKALLNAVGNAKYENAGKLSFDYYNPTHDDVWGNPLKGNDQFRKDYLSKGQIKGWLERTQLNQDVKDREEDNEGTNLKDREREYREKKFKIADMKEEALKKAQNALARLENVNVAGRQAEDMVNRNRMREAFDTIRRRYQNRQLPFSNDPYEQDLERMRERERRRDIRFAENLFDMSGDANEPVRRDEAFFQ